MCISRDHADGELGVGECGPAGVEKVVCAEFLGGADDPAEAAVVVVDCVGEEEGGVGGEVFPGPRSKGQKGQ